VGENDALMIPTVASSLPPPSISSFSSLTCSQSSSAPSDGGGDDGFVFKEGRKEKPNFPSVAQFGCGLGGGYYDYVSLCGRLITPA
jgi:hypothetical protein